MQLANYMKCNNYEHSYGELYGCEYLILIFFLVLEHYNLHQISSELNILK